MADLSDRIEELARSPFRVKGDAGEAQMPRLKDLVEAAKYLAGSSAVSDSPKRGIRITKLVPPGAD